MMKHTLRCHDFGWMRIAVVGVPESLRTVRNMTGQNRASPQGVAAQIAVSFVARLANIDILAAPRFALPTISAHTARAFHQVRGS
jgi:hypothetical protein